MKPRSKLFSFYNYMESKFVLPGIKATRKVTASRRELGGQAPSRAASQPSPPPVPPPKASGGARCLSPGRLGTGMGESPGVVASPSSERSPSRCYRGCQHPRVRPDPTRLQEQPRGWRPSPLPRAPSWGSPSSGCGVTLVPGARGAGPESPALGSPALPELCAPFTVPFVLHLRFPSCFQVTSELLACAAELAAPLV